MRALPPERWTRASDVLILHGRRICRPKPLCDRCKVRDGLRFLLARGDVVTRLAEAPAPARTTRQTPRQPKSAMTRDAFEGARRRGDRRHPAALPRARCRNIAIVVEDEPVAELLDEMEIEPPDTLLGLYQGTPLPERAWGYGNSCPIASRSSSGRSKRTATATRTTSSSPSARR